jgi:hypothetical protein
MTDPQPPAPAPGTRPRRHLARAALAVLLLAVTGAAAVSDPPAPPADPAAPPKETLVGGVPLFGEWPKDRKPDAVIVLSGQMYGYLQPCGCSRPQIGGLERRAVLIEALRAKGWPVAGVDLGDVYPEQPALAEQGRLKYVATLQALRDMGYLGVGVGETEIRADLISLLVPYALQKEQRPFTLAGNAVGVVEGKPVPRARHFPTPPDSGRPIVDQIEVGKVGAVSVGVAGVVGKSLQEQNQKQKWDAALDFPNAKGAIEDARAALDRHPDAPKLRVLIFQGPVEDAARVAKDFPAFQIVLCRSESDLPPLRPQTVEHKDGTRTLVVQVGHRGQYVGAVGAFKTADGRGFDLKYQLVPLGEEFVQAAATEPEALAKNKGLRALEWYAKEVKAARLLPKYPRTPHPAQIQARDLRPPAELTYVGTDACKGCHAAEFKKWTAASHSHAMDTLEKAAKRPDLRNFDGECVKCHSVGFDHPSGYVTDEATKHLRHVGCESCHGPGSGHAAAPRNKDFIAYMSPWKQAGAAKLPDAAFMKKMADTPAPERGKVAVPPAQQFVVGRVETMCMRCHDHDADPHFDLYKNWPKIDHTGLAPPGGWPEKPPKP